MDWNVKARSQKIPGVTGKFDLGVQNKAGKRLTKFCQESSLVIANTLFLNNTRDNFACQHHQMVNARIRLIAFFWQNFFSLYPVSFCIPRSNLPVTPGIS